MIKYPQPPVRQPIANDTKQATPEFIRYLVDIQNYIKQLEKRVKKLENS